MRCLATWLLLSLVLATATPWEESEYAQAGVEEESIFDELTDNFNRRGSGDDVPLRWTSEEDSVLDELSDSLNQQRSGNEGPLRWISEDDSRSRRLQYADSYWGPGGPPLPRQVWTRVGITNDSPVPGYWVVQELEMFWDDMCLKEEQVVTFGTDIYSTGTHRETKYITPGFAAFDGSFNTNWTADCRLSLGGCAARSVGLGMDIRTDKRFLAAYGVRNEQWQNVTKEYFDRITVKCIRIFQSDDPRFKADDIAVTVGYPDEEDHIYEVLQVFHSVAGGTWSQRPAIFSTLWRVDNLEHTVNKWSVTELRMFEDVLCTFPLEGKPISLGNEYPLSEGENNAFDGNYSSIWTANCRDIPGSIAHLTYGYGGCEPEQAYLGLDFSDYIVTVRCIRIYQKAPRDIGDEEQKRSWSGGFGLKQWTGEDWALVERYWDHAYVHIPLEYSRSVDTPFLGGAPGRWEDTRPPSRAAWRIANDDYTRGQWSIHELEFYEEPFCVGRGEVVPLQGTPIAMQGPRNLLESRKAFDGDPRQDMWWRSSCTKGLNGTCIPGEAWLGLYTRGRQPNVRCMRLFQSRLHNEQSIFMNLWVYNEGQWVIDSTHRDMGGGSWNRRPAPPWTMWRARNNDPIPAQWQVMEIRGFRDPLCILPTTEGNPLSSGHREFMEGPDNAIDLNAKTAWGADCDSCNLTRKYWLGIELPHDAKEQQDEEFLIRCFKIWQSPAIDQQVTSLQIQVWNGEFYQLSPMTNTGSAAEFGGGIWSRPISSHMTRWRLAPMTDEDRVWRLLEMEFYADSECKLRLPGTGEGKGGAWVLSSGYEPFVQGFRRAEKDRLWSEAEHVNDEDTTTGLLMEHRPSEGRVAYAGIDFLSMATWIRCIRLVQGSMPEEQVDRLQVEIWDGQVWKDSDPEMSKFEMKLEGLGGAGWQRRPAEPGSIWRLENEVEVPEGWALYEAEMYATADCGDSKLVGEPIASGYAPPMDDHSHANAFDGDVTTVWRSQCSEVVRHERPLGFEQFNFQVGCAVGAAWIGLDLGAGKVFDQVKCVRVYQLGYRRMQSSSIGVRKWDGERWMHTWSLGGLGGSSWDQRPAAGNSMWRLLHRERRTNICDGQLARLDHRAWGVAELKFFADDSCQEEVTGTPINSGAIENYIASVTDQFSYNVSRINDGDELTTWAANCLTGYIGVDSTKTNCSGEWVGLDFRSQVNVRCVQLIQSRLESSKCCDPASDVELQRWNGYEWVEATWYRIPPMPAVETASNVRQPVHLGAKFRKLGECPSRDSKKKMFEEVILEQRARRDSDNCIVKLTGAVTLLAEPMCIKHPACLNVAGTSGSCCPMGDLVQSDNRCCCNFLASEPIYEDEKIQHDLRQLFGFEYATIVLSNYLPWLGLSITISCYLAVFLAPGDAEQRMRRWIERDMEETSRRGRCRLLVKRLISIMLWPWLVWRTFIAESQTQTVKLVRWFILPEGHSPKPMQMWRSLVFLLFGVLLSGMAPWLLLGIFFGEIMIRLALQLTQVIWWFKSPFEPLDLRDMKLRAELSRVKVKSPDDTATALDVASGFVSTFVFGLAYFGKFIFDVLIVRAQMLSLEAIPNIEADRLVELFPGLLSMLRDPGLYVYRIMLISSEVIAYVLTGIVGIPLCEGSCALVGSVCLVMILYGASQWLNYDLFGLFVAARQMVKGTRPECQRIFAQAMILVFMSISFGSIQVTMVLFTRALAFANPFQQATWICPYDDSLALYIGRVMLSLSALIGLGFVFLCVNGHFFGQDYITARVAKFLDIDLDALDPDGAGDGGGWFRMDVFGAMVPTLAGVWWDPWNINAFLVKERAHVYAMELRDPQPCVTCGKIHTNYELMMTATGRTLSGAVQILPYGAVVAKASEYFNDPPLVYIGDSMSCLKVSKRPRQRVSMKNPITCTLLVIAEILALSIEYFVPLLRRAVSISSYAFVLIGTFQLTEENLVEHGTYVILAGFYLAVIRGTTFGLLPNFLSYCLGGVYFAIHRVEGTVKKANDLPRTISGQMLSGATCATLVAGSMITAEWGDMAGSMVVGSIVGYVFSLLTLLVNVLFESEAPGPEDPPTLTIFQILMKALYAVASGCLVGLFAIFGGEMGLPDQDNPDPYIFQLTLGNRLNFRGSIGVMVFMIGIQIITLRMVLVENLRWEDKDSPHQEYDWRKSPTWVVLRTVQFFPGMVGVPVSALSGLMAGNFVATQMNLNATAIQFVRMAAGIVVGNVTALTIHQLLEMPPMLLAFFCGIVSAAFLCNWNFLFGGICSVILGTLIGSIVEEYLIRRAVKEEKKRRDEMHEFEFDYFDHHRAEMQLNWDKESVVEVPPTPVPEPTREEKLQMYLEATAKGESATKHAMLLQAKTQDLLEDGDYPKIDEGDESQGAFSRPNTAPGTKEPEEQEDEDLQGVMRWGDRHGVQGGSKDAAVTLLPAAIQESAVDPEAEHRLWENYYYKDAKDRGQVEPQADEALEGNSRAEEHVQLEVGEVTHQVEPQTNVEALEHTAASAAGAALALRAAAEATLAEAPAWPSGQELVVKREKPPVFTVMEDGFDFGGEFLAKEQEEQEQVGMALAFDDQAAPPPATASEASVSSSMGARVHRPRTLVQDTIPGHMRLSSDALASNPAIQQRVPPKKNLWAATHQGRQPPGKPASLKERFAGNLAAGAANQTGSAMARSSGSRGRSSKHP
eukprot:gb/GFBE01015706.1/.p1 GENE.gb/GFBE01015706.1/~~gb/GFBE01015706.1/.p1  ORF type:complete len:2679 (+),score=463.31 gb/GFBE01015706.1/:1-8037(+)